jgi:hypothetical protein
MRAGLIRRGVVCLAVACLLAVGGAQLATAATETPWWGLSMGTQPTELQSGVARNEVQSLTVSGTQGDIAILEPKRLSEVNIGARTFEELLVAVVPYNATAGEMQAALEKIFPTRKLTVSGGPGDETGSSPYTITFPDQSVKPVVANATLAALFGGTSLSCEGAKGSGCKGEATVEVVSAGKPDGLVVASVENLGDGAANPAIAPVTVADELPAGLEAVAIEAVAGGDENDLSRGPMSCSLKSLTCSYEAGTYINPNNGEIVPKTVGPYEPMEVRVSVVAQSAASNGEEVSATIAGGGAARAVSASHALEIGGQERFGVEEYKLVPENADGTVDTQAGSHPFQLTSVINLDTQQPDPLNGEPRATRMAKDLIADLPAGLVGNPTPLPQCTDSQFNHQIPAEGHIATECPLQTAIGIAVITVAGHGVGFHTFTDPIFNMQPRPGEPARFAFKVAGLTPVYLDTSVRTGTDYGVTVESNNTDQTAWILSSKLTFWGVPGDPRHDPERGWQCLEKFGSCPPSIASAPPPFLSMPTSCEAPFESTLYGNSWAAPDVPEQVAEPVAYRLPEALDGCNHLPFDPSITVAPDVPDGSSSTGLTVGVHVPQTATLNPEGLAESTLRDTTVALPEGVALNPAGANGLQACSEAQIGFSGVQAGKDVFTPDLPNPFCPDASKIGTVKIETPLLPSPLEGAVYLAQQNTNPFGSLVAMYIVAQDPVSGTLVKLAGFVHLDESTGRVVATFENTPELPFEELELHFFGGERAPLGTPALCGAYTTAATFTPWSGNEAVRPVSTFDITSGPNGKPCSDPLPFAPSLTAGTTSIQAGGFSPFAMTMSREDGEQNLKAIQLRMPPGMSGTLSTVKLCGEAQADAGACGPESLIGETIISVGLGGDPYTVTGGKVYITGPYKGAPFGLSIVNPAKAGPYDLGQVVVRAKIEVDPETAALTITTDSEGPYKIPTIIDGIPLQIKHVNVDINRPGFTFNATNCSPLQISGKLESAEGASSSLAVPYQVTNCAVLAFKPKLTASTTGKTSRASGASLTVKLGYPAGPYDANIARVKVELPKQLPSQLKTLQKACTAAVFEANPANCPPASIIGHATATTPVLPVPLTGPAYFVSHGGEAFPSLIVVLQGYGVTVHLVGSTFISKQGITSSTFKSVPDVPVGSFELTLPQGQFSALTANTDLCKVKKLAMPTEIVGQNGAQINTSTKIQVTGCPKAKHASHEQKSTRKKKASHKPGKPGQGRERKG